MLDSTYAPPPRDAQELRPARALLTPTWLVALALLVANDHWLKGSGLLPDLLTGKLSDFAGMLVAPVLLASLLRVRSRRALLLCHLAVGAVFAGIQLAPAFAAQWSALMGMFGFPWVITCDPSDLIALPVLLLSWTVLVPEMDGSKPALLPMQRSAVAGLSVFGLWATVATSENAGFDANDEWFFDVDGNLYLNNANDLTISLHIRPLRSDLRIDCNEVALDPGRLLSQSAFGSAEHWELPPRTTIGLDLEGSGRCGAVWIAGEGIAPVVVFADAQQYSWRSFPGQVFNAEESGLGEAGLGIRFGEGGGEWIGNTSLRFFPKTEAPELPAACAAPSGESRIDWQESIPDQAVELLDISAGVDGCYELELQDLTALNGEVSSVGASYPFHLCVPEGVAPYAVGERLRFTQFKNGSRNSRELRVDLLDSETLEVAVAPNGAPVRAVRYLHGGDEVEFIGPAFNRDLIAIPAVACPWQVQTSCATVERSAQLAIAGEDEFLEPGVPMSFPANSQTGTSYYTVMVSYVRQRAVVDQSCADGAQSLGYDIDFVVIEEPWL